LKEYYSQTCAQRPPLGLQKAVVFQRWSLITVCSYKIAINFGKLVIRLVVVDGWFLTHVNCTGIVKFLKSFKPRNFFYLHQRFTICIDLLNLLLSSRPIFSTRLATTWTWRWSSSTRPSPASTSKDCSREKQQEFSTSGRKRQTLQISPFRYLIERFLIFF
jgi:hypothetical protein